MPAKDSEKKVSVLSEENITSPQQKELTNNSVTFKVNSKKERIISLPAVLYKGKNYNIWVNKEKVHSLSSKVLKVKVVKGFNSIKFESINNKNEIFLIFSVSSFLAFSMYLFFKNRQNFILTSSKF